MLPRENVEYGVLGGGCFVKKSRVEIFLRVERSVYKQGQYVRPVVECTVEKGDNLNTSHCSVLCYSLELETKIHTKVRNHGGEGPSI